LKKLKKNNVKFQIGFVRRFDKEWLEFKELMHLETIGENVVWRQVSAGAGPKTEWFYDIKKGAGPFIDGAVHSYDFALYTFGKAKKVESCLTRFKKFSSPDTGVVSVEFESGNILVLLWSWGLPEKCFTNGINDAIGPKGALIFEGIRDKEHKWFLLRKENGTEEKVGEMPIDTLGPAFTEQMDHFIDCIKNNKKPKVGYIEGRESLKIGLQALEQWRII